MKKYGAILCALVAATVLSGCAGGGHGEEMTSEPTVSTSTTPTEEPAQPQMSCGEGTIEQMDSVRQQVVELHLQTCIEVDEEGKLWIRVGTSDVLDRDVWLAVWIEHQTNDVYKRRNHRVTICPLPAGEREEEWFWCEYTPEAHNPFRIEGEFRAVASFELLHARPRCYWDESTPHPCKGQNEEEENEVIESCDSVEYVYRP